MRTVTSEKLSQLQNNQDRIRNICILAHVDHGKTTLADSLLASNGIISQRLAGKLRYLDSRKDEQERGITMKSSSVSLLHTSGADEYLINLIDSPGHVDFSTEVSTAVRLSDGALIVVDVVEGVCAQTIVALKQAWQENVKPVLVLNKIDRLILEVKLTPLDAYVHLTQVLEKVNAIMAELLTSDVMEKEHTTTQKDQGETNTQESKSSSSNGNAAEYYDWSSGLEEIDDSTLYFAPEQGNVIFTSASDGWGFRCEEFAQIYADKIGVKLSVLNKTLWGDFYVNWKLKRVVRGAQAKAKKPLFVQLVLENVWTLYDAICIKKNREAIEKIVSSLNLSLPPRCLKQTDFKQILNSVLSAWLPLSKSVLDAVCRKLPSPLNLPEERVERLMFSHHNSFGELPPEVKSLKKAFLECDSAADAPVIIFVSKMFAVESQTLPENRPKLLSAEEIAARRDQARLRHAEMLNQKAKTMESQILPPLPDPEYTSQDSKREDVNEEAFIAFARVFSGTLRKGSKLYVLGPRYDPADYIKRIREQDDDSGLPPNVSEAEIKNLYMLMGRELEALDQVPAGNVVGLGDLGDHVLKTATISSTLACPAFTDLNLIAVPILRVALEPAHTSDLSRLTHGLKLLNQADPCVQVVIQDNGEHVLVTAGEIHLEKCLDDLKNRFAKIEITASKPIVPFRETVIEPPKLDMVSETIDSNQNSKASFDVTCDKRTNVEQSTPNKMSTMRIRAAPLPLAVTKLLEDNVDLIRLLKTEPNVSGTIKDVLPEILSQLRKFKDGLQKTFEESGWDPKTVNRIWSFGPKKCGPNILINEVQHYGRGCVWPLELSCRTAPLEEEQSMYAYDSNFVNGFQLATLSGPLCEEPMMGVAFTVEDWKIHVNPEHYCNKDESEDGNTNQFSGALAGQIMSTVRDTCRKAFQLQPQRLVVAMYSCNIQVNSEVLGKLYAVLGKRGGRILSGDLQEGSASFDVTALLPVVESFNFANEVRRQTSGLALPQLIFHGWEVMELDPFWQPTTDEEYLHFGEKADSENRARKYMNAIRRRKGLRVEEKTVEFAEKQRTLTRNK